MTTERRDKVAKKTLARVMSGTGAARFQGLIRLARVHPQYAPIWVALAHEHWNSRRTEEALSAARKAIVLDPQVHARFTIDLKLACRSMVAELGAHTPEAIGQSSPAPTAVEPLAETEPHMQQLLDTALTLDDRQERVAVLEELLALAPEDGQVLFHLAKELAVVERMDDARDIGALLRKRAPERYTALYEWAGRSLINEQAAFQANRVPSMPLVQESTASADEDALVDPDTDEVAVAVEDAMLPAVPSELSNTSVVLEEPPDVLSSARRPADIATPQSSESITVRLLKSQLDPLVNATRPPGCDS